MADVRGIVILTLLASLLTSACSGDAGTRGASPSVAGTRTTVASPTPVGAEGAPVARMQAGTDSIEGVLVRFCDGDDCEAADASPPRVLRLAEDGLMLFVVDRAPESARVEIRRDGDAEVQERGSLDPGTLMGFSSRLARGRYDVRLIGRWGAQKAVWRFGLTVPPAER